MTRNYSSISPSAKALLLTKALTDIPFTTDAARIIWGETAGSVQEAKKESELFLMRLLHFEVRYKSIDKLVQDLGSSNIFEISSGFSFRGLDAAVRRAEVFYIDTDLPDVVADKQKLIEELVKQKGLVLKGQLIVQALNALHEDEFMQLLAKFPGGPICIVNEGLLMYLNTEEKIRLCRIIRKALQQSGGYWITADIYIKKDLSQAIVPDQFSQFLAAHNVEDNKFDSYEQAEKFFKQQGFKIHRKAAPADRSSLSSLRLIDPEVIRSYAQKAGGLTRIRETWVLVVGD